VRAHGKGLELMTNILSSVPEFAIGDATRIRQILMNLMGNAIKFTAAGEVEIEVGTEPGNAYELCLRLSVRDTGIGIPADKQAMIFESFSQADTSTTREYGGTGLGLTICSRLVSAMRGTIAVESAPGKGSRFTCRVWLGRTSAQLGATDRKSAARVSLAGISVLIVDDNATNRRILTESVEAWGMRPQVASSAPEALLLVSQSYRDGHPFGLILLDVQMPGMDGFELIENLNASPERHDAVIVMLTSSESRGELARCKALGISMYLTKPIRRAELRSRIVSAITNAPAVDVTRAPETLNPFADLRLGWAGTARRILLAEDNAVNQRLTLRILERAGYSVALADNGRIALERLEEESFDLVLMDVQMPELDGFEATREIRHREIRTRTHIPIVAMTAHAMTGDRERCLEAGMDDYITKPISAANLLKAIEALVTDYAPLSAV